MCSGTQLRGDNLPQSIHLDVESFRLRSFLQFKHDFQYSVSVGRFSRVSDDRIIQRNRRLVIS